MWLLHQKIHLKEMVRLNKDTFRNISSDAGLPMVHSVTPIEAVNIKSLLRLPMSKVRKMTRCLTNLNVNIFPSERKMRAAQAP